MRTKTFQSGFAKLGLLAIVVVLLVGGVAVWLLVSKPKTNDSVKTDAKEQQVVSVESQDLVTRAYEAYRAKYQAAANNKSVEAFVGWNEFVSDELIAAKHSEASSQEINPVFCSPSLPEGFNISLDSKEEGRDVLKVESIWADSATNPSKQIHVTVDTKLSKIVDIHCM